jgi:hypothetical protein
VEKEEEAERVMVSTISFIQAKAQQSTAGSRVLTRTAVVKGIDMALIQEPRYHEGRSMDLNIPEYTVFSEGWIDLQLVFLRGT